MAGTTECRPARLGAVGATVPTPPPSDTIFSLSDRGAKLSSDSANTPNGNYNQHDVGYTGTKWMRSVLAFDLPAIETGSGQPLEIASAKLTLRHSAQGISRKISTIDLHELKASFEETEVTWNSKRRNEPWATPGGDFKSIALSSLSLAPADFAASDFSTFESTYSFTEAVEAAYANGSRVLYLILKIRDETRDDTGFFRFSSDDTGILENRPKLTVEYRTARQTRVIQSDSNDATAALQAALDDPLVGRVKVPFRSEPWHITSTIWLRNNKDVIFEPGVVVEAKRDFFKGLCDSLFLGREISGVRLIGQRDNARGGARIIMHRDDYLGPDYVKDKNQHARHAINIEKSTNVEIFNLHIQDAGADGIYVGRLPFIGGDYSENVLIRNVSVDGSGRDGLSICGGQNVTVDNSSFNNSGPISSSVGIDVEPPQWVDRAVDILIRNTTASGNGTSQFGTGFAAALQSQNSGSPQVSLRFLDCFASDNREGFALRGHNSQFPTVKGNVDFVRCTSDRSHASGVYILNKAADSGDPADKAFLATFSDIRVLNPNRTAGVPAVEIVYDDSIIDGLVQGNPRIGGLRFENVFVQEAGKHSFLGFMDKPNVHTLVDVQGDFVVNNPTGAVMHLGDNHEDVNVTVVQGDGTAPMRVFSEDVAPVTSQLTATPPIVGYQHGATVLNERILTRPTDIADGQDLVAGRKGKARRTVLSFNLSAIPPGTITAAKLRLNYSDGFGNAPLTLRVHALTRDFDETKATWTHAAENIPWTTAGGDYSTTTWLLEETVVPDEVEQGTPEVPKHMTFRSGSEFVNAVTAAYNSDKILKLIIVAVDDTTLTSDRWVSWRSDDIGDNVGPGRREEGVIRPRLFVSYRPLP